MENEIWKPVPGMPMLASSLGRILLQPSYAPLPNGGFRLYAPKPTYGSIRSATKDARHRYLGYIYNGKKNVKVHRAVCMAFHGEPPFEGAVVIHIDENAFNNRPENLRWGTQKENLNMPGFLEYCRGRVGENSPTVKALAKAG